MSFKGFSLPFTIISFSWLPRNYLLILKMLTETRLIIPFSVIGRFSPVSTPHWLLGKDARLVTGGFRYDLQNHRRLPLCIFSVKIAEFGFLKRFPKVQAKTSSLIISSNKKTNICYKIS
jgi:hypothetical protein